VLEQDDSFGTKTAVRDTMHNSSHAICREAQMQARQACIKEDNSYFEDYCTKQVQGVGLIVENNPEEHV